jgi:DNA repair protein RecO (recombination protein O)
MSEVAAAPPERAFRRRSEQRVDHQPGFVLHSYPWRETSLVVEAFTRAFGRVALLRAVRGVRRRSSAGCCHPLTRWLFRGAAAMTSRR